MKSGITFILILNHKLTKINKKIENNVCSCNLVNGSNFFRKGKMDTGYIDNGFIVDLSHTSKTSEVIYELSRILDMPESKGKYICLKLGGVNLSSSELTSIKTLVELMESHLECISTSSQETLEAASTIGLKISEFTNEIQAPVFEEETNQNAVVSDALDKIFGSGIPEKNKEEIEKVVRQDSETADWMEDEIERQQDEEVLAKKNEPENLPTLYIKHTVRSGQSISSDGNVIIIGDVNPGAEVLAKGDITVWGILGGIAHAGSEGNNYARIRALKLNPVQIRIGEIFARRPDTVNLPYIQKTSEYIPEEAFAYKGSIIIRKIHEN